jgi:hypothetical protein
MNREVNVNITGDARNYIAANGCVITVDVIFFHGCGVGNNDTTVTNGAPLKPDDYDLVTSDGFQIYLKKNVAIDSEGIRISMPNDWRANLQVEGLIFEPTYVKMN